MFLKYSFYALIVLVIFWGASWTFNYINPWLGIGIVVALVLFLGNKIYNHLNKQK